MGSKTGDHWFRIAKLLKSLTLIVNLTSNERACCIEARLDLCWVFKQC